MTKFLNISTDNTLGGSSASDETVSSQKAIKGYVDGYALHNTATGTYSLTIDGVASTKNYCVNIGHSSSANANSYCVAVGNNSNAAAEKSVAIGNSSIATEANGVAIGYNSEADGKNGIAIGYEAHSRRAGAIQIGEGTNLTPCSLAVGLYNGTSTTNYFLLNSNGKVPVARYISMTGADGTNAGTTGSVPAPAATDNTKFLRGDGTWAAVSVGGVSWGGITGTLSDQTDLKNALDAKQDASTAVTHTASTAVGSSTQPVYIASDGSATATTYSLSKSVPSDAVFTDTTYTGSDGITLTGTNFTNSGVRSVSSGSTNGTISVNTNGTSAEVAVAGLGSAAYTASTAYATSAQGGLADTAIQPNDNVSELVNDAGYITGITSSDVTTALGYTPYDSSNPSGYTSNVGTVTSVNNVSPVNGNVSISVGDTLPSQTGQSGKFLTTNGTSTSWATVSGGATMTYNSTTETLTIT